MRVACKTRRAALALVPSPSRLDAQTLAWTGLTCNEWCLGDVGFGCERLDKINQLAPHLGIRDLDESTIELQSFR